MTKKSSKRNNKKNVSKVSKRKGSKVSKRKVSKVSKRKVSKVSKRKGSKRKVSKKKDKRKRHKSSGKKTKKQKGSGDSPLSSKTKSLNPTAPPFFFPYVPSVVYPMPTTSDDINVRCHNIGVASQDILKVPNVDSIYSKIEEKYRTNNTGNTFPNYTFPIYPLSFLPSEHSQSLKPYLQNLKLSSMPMPMPNLLLLQEVFFDDKSLSEKNNLGQVSLTLNDSEKEIAKQIALFNRPGQEEDSKTTAKPEKIGTLDNISTPLNVFEDSSNYQYIRNPTGNSFRLVELPPTSPSQTKRYKCLSSNLVIVFDKSRFKFLESHHDLERTIICVLEDMPKEGEIATKYIIINLQLKINSSDIKGILKILLHQLLKQDQDQELESLISSLDYNGIIAFLNKKNPQIYNNIKKIINCFENESLNQIENHLRQIVLNEKFKDQIRENLYGNRDKNLKIIADLNKKIKELKVKYSNAKIILGGDFNDDYFHPSVQDEPSYEGQVKAFSNVLFDNYDNVRKLLQELTDNLTNVFHDNSQSTNYFPETELKKTEKKVDFLFTDMAFTNSEIDAKPTELTIKQKNKASEPKNESLRTIGLTISNPSTGKPNPLLTDENFHQFGDHNALQAVLKK